MRSFVSTIAKESSSDIGITMRGQGFTQTKLTGP